MRASIFTVKTIQRLVSLRIPRVSTLVREMATANAEEQKVNVNGVNINYLTVGNGPKTVLLYPGAIGSIWTDFKPQVDHLDREKFTIVAWDPPGYGKSRPPNRLYTENFYAEDATLALDLMEAIGHKKFSVIGWSDGGISSLVLAANNPDNVERMILIGASSYVLPEELRLYKSLRNIDTWAEYMRSPLIALYGEGYFRTLWASWVDNMCNIYEKNKGDICTNLLQDVKCPTLIVQGTLDAMIHKDHPTFLHKNIKNSRLEMVPNAGHNLHLRYWQNFNKMATEFLSSD